MNDVVPIDWLRMFDAQELQVLISGADVPIDLKDLREYTKYVGKGTPLALSLFLRTPRVTRPSAIHRLLRGRRDDLRLLGSDGIVRREGPPLAAQVRDVMLASAALRLPGTASAVLRAIDTGDRSTADSQHLRQPPEAAGHEGRGTSARQTDLRDPLSRRFRTQLTLTL